MINAQGKVEFHLRKNALHSELGIKSGEKIPSELLATKLAAAKKSGNTILEKRIIFAQNAKHFKH